MASVVNSVKYALLSEEEEDSGLAEFIVQFGDAPDTISQSTYSMEGYSEQDFAKLSRAVIERYSKFLSDISTQENSLSDFNTWIDDLSLTAGLYLSLCPRVYFDYRYDMLWTLDLVRRIAAGNILSKLDIETLDEEMARLGRNTKDNLDEELMLVLAELCYECFHQVVEEQRNASLVSGEIVKRIFNHAMRSLKYNTTMTMIESPGLFQYQDDRLEQWFDEINQK
ncbi:hypothetical protein TRVA0_057S00452 [Trichomonascus vanleenenianus]|uniref:uncharacterized protein n=1 Tax=Trichomonascus vanleenenianus TaxID=2268995 RepID=UPI003ECA11B8